jgi:hypothetical protein
MWTPRSVELEQEARNPLGRALVLGLGLVASLAWGGWLVLDHFEPPPPSAESAWGAPPVVEAERKTVRALVIEVVGSVERTQGAQWREVSAGDALAPDESVRTGPGSRVDLRLGDEASRLSIPERSEVRLGEVTRSVHTLRLERGRIDVDYREQEDRVLRVGSDQGAVAETRAARFTLSRHTPWVAVVTRTGSVTLSSAGVSVQVDAGQQSVVFDGAQPLAAQPIPVEVLLKVAAKASADSSLCLSISGQVRAGTRVEVEDEPVVVSQEGAFQVEWLPSEHRSQVKVVAHEPGGATREARLVCQPRLSNHSSPVESVKFRWNEAP